MESQFYLIIHLQCLGRKNPTRRLNNYPYIIIDDNQDHILETQAMASRFGNLSCIGTADNYSDGLDLILQYNPGIVFLEIDPENRESNLSLALINEVYRYLKVQPKFIITTKGQDFALDAIKHEVFDYLVKPLQSSEFRKSILKFEKTAASDIPQSFSQANPEELKKPVLQEEAIKLVPIEESQGVVLSGIQEDRKSVV